MENYDQMVEKVLEGDPRAQSALYRQFQPDMLRLANLWLPSPLLAEEAVNGGLAAMFTKFPQYVHEGAECLRKWITGFVMLEVMQTLRKAGRRSVLQFCLPF